MGVAVDEQVDALDVLHHIIGAVGLGGLIHAQVAQSDDDIGIPLAAGHVHILLGDLVQILAFIRAGLALVWVSGVAMPTMAMRNSSVS